MSKLRDPNAVAAATGCPLAAVQVALPIILEALNEQGILQAYTVVGALATVTVECSFKPVEEAYYLSERARNAYFDKSAYGKVDPQTGHRYYGRGYIQLTWRSNYLYYGKKLGLDLVHHPELALQHHTAARILAVYFKERGAADACQEQDWRRARKLVNGGFNGWARFEACVKKLLPLAVQE